MSFFWFSLQFACRQRRRVEWPARMTTEQNRTHHISSVSRAAELPSQQATGPTQYNYFTATCLLSVCLEHAMLPLSYYYSNSPLHLCQDISYINITTPHHTPLAHCIYYLFSQLYSNVSVEIMETCLSRP